MMGLKKILEQMSDRELKFMTKGYENSRRKPVFKRLINTVFGYAPSRRRYLTANKILYERESDRYYGGRFTVTSP